MFSSVSEQFVSIAEQITGYSTVGPTIKLEKDIDINAEILGEPADTTTVGPTIKLEKDVDITAEILGEPTNPCMSSNLILANEALTKRSVDNSVSCSKSKSKLALANAMEQPTCSSKVYASIKVEKDDVKAPTELAGRMTTNLNTAVLEAIIKKESAVDSLSSEDDNVYNAAYEDCSDSELSSQEEFLSDDDLEFMLEDDNESQKSDDSKEQTEVKQEVTVEDTKINFTTFKTLMKIDANDDAKASKSEDDRLSTLVTEDEELLKPVLTKADQPKQTQTRKRKSLLKQEFDAVFKSLTSNKETTVGSSSNKPLVCKKIKTNMLEFNDSNSESSNMANDTTQKRQSKSYNTIIAQWKRHLECDICKEQHENYFLLRKHFQLAHANEEPHILCCGKKLISRMQIADHAILHMDADAFKCVTCNTSYKTSRSLWRHQYMFHRNATDEAKQHKCNICGILLLLKLDLEEHMTKHNNEDLYKCLDCSNTYRQRARLFLHIRKTHTERWSERKNNANFLQSMRIVATNSENDESDEIKTIPASDRENDDIISQWQTKLECALCQDPYDNYTLLTKHFEHKHPTAKPHILCCGKKLMSRLSLVDHAKLHLDPNACKCPTCNIFFSSKDKLCKHNSNYHLTGKVPTDITCQICNKSYLHQIDLDEHMSKHTRQYIYKCLVCCKPFSVRARLFAHISKSHSEKWCQRKSIPNFLESMRIKEEVGIPRISSIKEKDAIIQQWKPKLECALCQAEHDSFLFLWQHFRQQHSNEKPYILCCGKKLMSRLKIAEHASYHLDPTAFKCKDCPKSCETKRQLYFHWRQYHAADGTPAELRKCGICNKTFQSKINLDEHMSRHTNTNTYQCLVCDKPYSFRTRLFSHIRKAHPNIWTLEMQNNAEILESMRVTVDLTDSAGSANPELILHTTLNYRCEFCNITFTSKISLLRHLRELHYDDLQASDYQTPALVAKRLASIALFNDIASWKFKINCGICQMAFPNYAQLAKHFVDKQHKQTVHAFCCSYKLTDDSITDHVLYHDNLDLFKCEICGQCCIHSKALEDHMQAMHNVNTAD